MIGGSYSPKPDNIKKYADSYRPFDKNSGRFSDSGELQDRPPSSSTYISSRSVSVPPVSNRWDSLKPDPTTRFYSSRHRAQKNYMGFHGSLRPSSYKEKELFESSEHVTEGINFDNVRVVCFCKRKYDNIPVEVNGDNIPEPITEFTEEYIPKSLLQNIIRCDYHRPTPVQKYGLAIGCNGRDLMACAQTGRFLLHVFALGSGKTAGFLFPLIISMLRNGASDAPLPDHGYSECYFPTCLILSPTRELALQIYQESQRVAGRLASLTSSSAIARASRPQWCMAARRSAKCSPRCVLAATSSLARRDA